MEKLNLETALVLINDKAELDKFFSLLTKEDTKLYHNTKKEDRASLLVGFSERLETTNTGSDGANDTGKTAEQLEQERLVEIKTQLELEAIVRDVMLNERKDKDTGIARSELVEFVKEQGYNLTTVYKKLVPNKFSICGVQIADGFKLTQDLLENKAFVVKFKRALDVKVICKN